MIILHFKTLNKNNMNYKHILAVYLILIKNHMKKNVHAVKTQNNKATGDDGVSNEYNDTISTIFVPIFESI